MLRTLSQVYSLKLCDSLTGAIVYSGAIRRTLVVQGKGVSVSGTNCAKLSATKARGVFCKQKAIAFECNLLSTAVDDSGDMSLKL